MRLIQTHILQAVVLTAAVISSVTPVAANGLVQIELDPGNVGEIIGPSPKTLAFTDLNGLAANGQAELFIFEWSDMKSLEETIAIGFPTQIRLTLFWNEIVNSNEGISLGLSGYADESGVIVKAPSAVESETTALPATTFDLFGPQDADFTFHDLNIRVTLPTWDDFPAQITGAELQFIPGNGGATWTIVPEPASLALLGLGGLAMLRRNGQDRV